MKCHLYLLSLLFILSIKMNAQTQELINLKGRLFLGAELGSNTILSYTMGEPTTSAQGGLMAEYFFTKYWGMSARLKYFKTGVSFFEPGDTIFNYINEGYSGTFHGAVVSIPVNVSFEFKLKNKLKGFFSGGLAFNLETKSRYSNYTSNVEKKYPKNYLGVNAGVGIHYYLNNTTSLYMRIEAFSGGSKGETPSILNDYHFTSNFLANVGVKTNIPLTIQ